MLWIYGLIMTAAVIQAVLLALQSWEHRRYSRARLGDVARQPAWGRVCLICPCKGVDVALEDNLRRLFEQDHDDYEIRFVVESPLDPACGVIERLIGEYPGVAAKLVIAGRATRTGQKIHNLQVATESLPEPIDVVAFVDSDAQPRPWWLRMLVSQLARDEIGATTGYRWFLPEKPTAANCVVYAINGAVATLLNRNSWGFLWGGSWATRRATFDALGIRQAWQGVLSDDLVAGRQFRQAGAATRFDPACMVASPLSTSAVGALGFLRRQYLMARYYAPWWWRLGLVSALLTAAAWISTAALLGASLAGRATPVSFPLGFGGALYATTVYRGWLRRDVARLHFPELGQRLAWPGRVDMWLGPLVALVNFGAIAASMFGRRVSWRNRWYVLDGDGWVCASGEEAGRTASGSRADAAGAPIAPHHGPPRAGGDGGLLRRRGLRRDGPHRRRLAPDRRN